MHKWTKSGVDSLDRGIRTLRAVPLSAPCFSVKTVHEFAFARSAFLSPAGLCARCATFSGRPPLAFVRLFLPSPSPSFRLRFNASRALRIHSPVFEESKEALSLDRRRRASDRFAAPTRCPARRKGDLKEETEWRMRNSRAQVCNMIFGIGMRLSALLSRPLYALQIEVSYRNIQAMGEPK